MPNKLNNAFQNLLMNRIYRSEMVSLGSLWFLYALSLNFIAASRAVILDFILTIRIIQDNFSATIEMALFPFLVSGIRSTKFTVVYFHFDLGFIVYASPYGL